MEPEVCHIRYILARVRAFLLACVLAGGVSAQVPFSSTGQVFAVIKSTNELHVFTVQAGYNSSTTIPVGSLPAGGLDAVGFRRTDRFLYGLGRSDNHLYRIGQGAVFADLGRSGSTTTCAIWRVTSRPTADICWQLAPRCWAM